MAQSRSFFDDPPGSGGNTVVCSDCGLSQPFALDCAGCGKVLQVKPAAKPASGGFLEDPLPTPGFQASEPVKEPAEEPVEGDLYDGGDLHDGGGLHDGGDLYDENRYAATSVRAVGRTSTDELTAFGLFRQTLSVFGRQFVGYLLISALALTPAFIISAVTDSTILAVDAGSLQGEDLGVGELISLPLILMYLLVVPLCSVIATTAVTCGVSRELRGKAATIVDSLTAGLSAVVPASFVMLIQSLLIGVVASIAFFLTTLAVIPFAVFGGGCVLVGMLVLVGLGVARFAASFAVTIPATVEERPGILGALRRSFSLVAGAEWLIVRFYILLGVVVFAVALVSFLGAAALGEGGEMIVTQVGNVVTIALYSVGSAVLYYRLRSIEEGVPVEHLESTLD